MKRHVCCVVLISLAVACHAQASKNSVAPDLSRFSSNQLKACFDDKSICGTGDVYAISDELQKRLPRLSTATLVACFADWRICGVGNDLATGWAVSDEVARRGDPNELLIRYWTEPDEDVRYGIVHVAFHFNTPEVTAFMKKVLAAGNRGEDALYWPADYLAKKCDPDGLKWLSTRNDRPEGCIVFTGAVKVFGKCHYRPGIPYLVNNSLQDASLNIVDDAEESLEKLYPDHPAKFDTLEAVQRYYCGRALKEGYRVDCSPN